MSVVKTTVSAQRRVRQLDRSRDYGQIYGASSGAVYEQDGCQFDAQGSEIVSGFPLVPEDDSFPDPPKR